MADPTAARLEREFKHARPLIGCRFDPSGRFLFVSSEDDTIQRFDLLNGAKTALAGHKSWVRGMAFVGGSRSAASEIEEWERATRGTSSTRRLRQRRPARAHALALHARHRRLPRQTDLVAGRCARPQAAPHRGGTHRMDSRSRGEPRREHHRQLRQRQHRETLERRRWESNPHARRATRPTSTTSPSTRTARDWRPAISRESSRTGT